MITPKHSRGEGKLGCVIWLLIVVFGGLVLYRVVPTRIAISELNDHMVDVCIGGAYASEEEMKNNVVARAKDLNLPVSPGDVSVTKTRERIIMDVKFNMTYDLVVKQWNKEISLHEDRPYFK